MVNEQKYRGPINSNHVPHTAYTSV